MTPTYILLKDYSTPGYFIKAGTKSSRSEHLTYFFDSGDGRLYFTAQEMDSNSDWFQRVEPEVKEFTESEVKSLWDYAYSKGYGSALQSHVPYMDFKDFIKSIRDKK